MLNKMNVKILVSLILSISLMLGYAVTASAGEVPEPPLPGEHLMGPAVIGDATLDGTFLNFDGNCKGNAADLVNLPFTVNLDTLEEADLENYRIEGGTDFAPDCWSTPGDIIINTVISFSPIEDEFGNVIQVRATVIVLSVVAK